MTRRFIETMTESSGKFQPVVTNDAVDLPFTSEYLIVATGGTLKVTSEMGDIVTLTVPAGELRIRVTRVWATGTSATGITACFGG